MIKQLVNIFIKHKSELEKQFAEEHPCNYQDLVERTFKLIADYFPEKDSYKAPDWKNIHEINDGGWQGTLLFLLPFKTYQPDEYYYVKIDYGSCSGCDTFQAIQGYNWIEKPTEEQVKGYLRLCLHIVQGTKTL